MIHLHTCFITYNRFDLTVQAVTSYLETVSLPYTWLVVDNGSTDGTVDWLQENDMPHIALGGNRFPGYACNRGWEQMPPNTKFLHRADNDFIFLPNWCDHVLDRFKSKKIGQVGLRTNEEEEFAPSNVGGNNMIRRTLWDMGLRYDERPWGHPEIPKGWTEDSLLSPAVKELGFGWTRVKDSCIEPISDEDPSDPYYIESWKLRGIETPS